MAENNVENIENEVVELSPSEYFEQVKERKNHITDEDLQKVYDNCLELLNKYKITGQKKGMRKLMFHLECIEKEREIVKMGIDTFIYRDDIEEYIDILVVAWDSSIRLEWLIPYQLLIVIISPQTMKGIFLLN